jgi:hypothetical protein
LKPRTSKIAKGQTAKDAAASNTIITGSLGPRNVKKRLVGLNLLVLFLFSALRLSQYWSICYPAFSVLGEQKNVIAQVVVFNLGNPVMPQLFGVGG